MRGTVPIAGVCHQCGTAVRNREPGTQVESVVWERLGRGSSRSVTLRESTGRVLCRSCTPQADGTGILALDV